ncbi:MAG TPA: glycosyltransferase, partial [Longimicrobiales bacterium]|nr:glycosyltransferase [Longimicrobiales bacterium]
SHVVHLGLDDAASTTRPYDAVPAALMVSRLHPDERYKGHDEVLAAWPLVLERIPGAQLWIAGEGELQSELESSVARHKLDENVRFFGRVSDTEKRQLIARSRCLLMPSTGEGFGLVYLEAMRQGRPCLSGIDGGREVINPPEAGLSVTHRTPQEIADAVVRLMRGDDAWHELSARAKHRYEQQFTSKHFAERLNNAITEVAR